MTRFTRVVDISISQFVYSLSTKLNLLRDNELLLFISLFPYHGVFIKKYVIFLNGSDLKLSL